MKVLSSSRIDIEEISPNLQINATVIESTEKIEELDGKPNKNHNITESFRNVNVNKIQSNTKDIINDNNFNILPNFRVNTTFLNAKKQINLTEHYNLTSKIDASENLQHRKRHQRQLLHTSFKKRMKRLKNKLVISERNSEIIKKLSLQTPNGSQDSYLDNVVQKYKSLAAKWDEKPQNTEPTLFEHTHSHSRITRAATAKKERVWDFGVIPYEIDGNFSGAHKAL